MSDLSICIPTYRRPEMLDRCLTRLEAQLPRLRLNIQIIISDNNNGNIYDSLWIKYERFFELYNIVVISTPVTIAAHENWYNALKCVTSENFIIMSDDDYFHDLSILDEIAFKGKTVFLNSLVIKNTTEQIKKNFYRNIDTNSILVFLLICIGIIKPTLCSTIMKTSGISYFLKHKPEFGPNGDHLDGFLILSSLNASEFCSYVNRALTCYSLEGQGYSNNRNIVNHLIITKYRFIKHTFRCLGIWLTILALIWTMLGGIKVILDFLRKKLLV